MLLIGQAICQNHMGLAELHRLRDGTKSEDSRKKYRTKARTRFRRAIGLAEQAKALAIKVDDVVFAQARDGAEGIVWQILPVDLWELVARDYLCRALDRDEAITGYRDVILARLRVIDEDDPAYAAGHYVQLCRLAIELVRLVYRAGEADAPVEVQLLESETDGTEFLRLADWAIDEVMEDAIARYVAIAGDRHPWLLSWFDARLIRAAAQWAGDAAETAVKEAQTFFPADMIARRPDLAAAMTLFRQRVEACRKANLLGAASV